VRTQIVNATARAERGVRDYGDAVRVSGYGGQDE
jgi:hypothetical protein